MPPFTRHQARARGGPFHASRAWHATDALASPSPPVGELVETISEIGVNDGHAELTDRLGITDTRFIASYNWLDGSPIIAVPGKPPLWTPLPEPCRLREDDGIYYRDRNAASYPAHPLEPAIVSVMQMSPTPVHVDLFACGSTIGNLLRFVRGGDQPFRMLVEVVGKTVHLIRRENSPKEQILGVRGYGHTFPEAYTMWEPEVKRSLSHQRILKYKFGGLDMMVRFEGDGYIKSGRAQLRESDPDGTDLLDQFQELDVVQNSAAVTSQSSTPELRVVKAGESVPQGSILEVKTRSIKKNDDDILVEQLPRLWVAQVSNFVVAYHEKGVFSDVEVRDIEDQVLAWEEENQPALSRFLALLRRIIDTALSSEEGELEIVREEGDVLEIRRRASDVGDAFSQGVRRDWAQWLEGAAGPVGTESDDPTVYEFPRWDAYDEDSGSDGGGDFTACDAECGYCGKCS